MKEKQFRVQMDGSMEVWATNVDEALREARDGIGMYLYAQETGEERGEDDDDEI